MNHLVLDGNRLLFKKVSKTVLTNITFHRKIEDRKKVAFIVKRSILPSYLPSLCVNQAIGKAPIRSACKRDNSKIDRND